MSSFAGRLLVAGTVTIVFAIVLASVAFAHAEFVSSTPASNSTLRRAPATVKALFSEGVNSQGSSFTVVGPNGARADQNDGHVDRNDPDRKTMLVSLKPGLGPGKYTVNWTTISTDDGDKASGSFVFTVARAAPTALPRSGGLPTFSPIVGGIALLVAGLALRLTGLRRTGH